MAKKITERNGGMVCRPSKETRAKLSKAGRARYKGSMLEKINILAKQLQIESGTSKHTIAAKVVEKYNLSREDAVFNAGRTIRGQKSFKNKY